MTEQQLYDEAFAQMAPLEQDEAQAPRRWGGAGRGQGRKSGGRNPNGGRRQRKTLLINGVLQDGLYKVVEVNKDTIVIESV